MFFIDRHVDPVTQRLRVRNLHQQRAGDQHVRPRLAEEEEWRGQHHDQNQIIRSPEQPPAGPQRREVRRQLFTRIEVHERARAERHAGRKRQQREHQAAKQQRYHPAPVQRRQFAAGQDRGAQHDQRQSQDAYAQIRVTFVLSRSGSRQPMKKDGCPAARINRRQNIHREDAIAAGRIATSACDHQTERVSHERSRWHRTTPQYPRPATASLFSAKASSQRRPSATAEPGMRCRD